MNIQAPIHLIHLLASQIDPNSEFYILDFVGNDNYSSPVSNQFSGTLNGVNVGGNSKNSGLFLSTGPFDITGRSVTLIGRDSSAWIVEGVAPW